MWKGHYGRRVFSLLLSLFNCEQFHSLRTYQNRTSNSNIEENCMLDKSNANPVSKTKSTRNQTSAFMNRNSVRIPSLFTHIELKVPSGSVSPTRVNPVFKSSILNWRFSRAAFPNRTERVCLSVEPLEQIQCSNQNTNRTCLPQNETSVFINQTSVFTFTLTLPITSNWKFDRAAIHCKTLDL